MAGFGSSARLIRPAHADTPRTGPEAADADDGDRKVWLFSLVLVGNSRWLWGHFCTDQKLETVLRCHVMAFEACGGAPAEVLYDRVKTAVLGKKEDETVIYNPSLVALLQYAALLPYAPLSRIFRV